MPTVVLDYETDNGRRGLGDIIISTPIIEALRYKYAQRIDIVLRKEAQILLQNNPHIRHVYTIDDEIKCDLRLVMGWKLEHHNVRRNNQARIDAMCELFSVYPAEKCPRLYFPEVEKLPNSIGISIESTNPVREWRTDYMIKLISRFPQLDWHVFGQKPILIYGDSPAGLTPPAFHNHLGKLDLTDLIHLVSRMERFVTVDSLFSHLTAAFDIPTIVMYTEVPREWRCSYYPNTIGIQAQVDCSPCWERQRVEFEAKINECYSRQNSGQSIKCVDSFTPDLIEKAIHDYLL